MDVRQLNSFVHIVNLKSFTKAAEQLRIAQPALGLQIRKLEEELQVQLLVRHSRGVEPTAAGLSLMDHARDILDRIAAARHAMNEFTGPPRGRVLLGMTPSINYMVSAALIKACRRDLPEVSLSIEEQLSAVLLEWLATERLDMCVAHKLTNVSGLLSVPMFQELLYLVGRRGDLPERETITFAEIAEHPLILPCLPHGLRRLIDAYAQRHEVPLDIVFEMQSVSVVQNLISQGVGSTILPYGGARRSVASGDIKALKIVEPEILREIISGIGSATRPRLPKRMYAH